MSVLVRLAYDGTDFHGFARQPGQRTVQGELERVLTELYREPVLTRGASRTDAGVHARGQLVAFDEPGPIHIPIEGLGKVLPARLERDVVAWRVWSEGAPGLEPRFGNLGKHYRYRIRVARLRDPLTDRQEWHHEASLDLEAMRAAAARLIGEHDFGSFRAADCQARTTVRRLDAIEIRESSDDEARNVVVDVHGQAFLKYMVRIMVGTLVEAGRGRRAPGSVDELLRRPDRTRAGMTAPARGLTLMEVKWPAASGVSAAGTTRNEGSD